MRQPIFLISSIIACFIWTIALAILILGKDENIDLAGEIERLNAAIGLPKGLAEMGVTEEMIPHLVAHSMTDPSNATTPRLPTQEEWEKLFLEAM